MHWGQAVAEVLAAAGGEKALGAPFLLVVVLVLLVQLLSHAPVPGRVACFLVGGAGWWSWSSSSLSSTAAAAAAAAVYH